MCLWLKVLQHFLEQQAGWYFSLPRDQQGAVGSIAHVCRYDQLSPGRPIGLKARLPRVSRDPEIKRVRDKPRPMSIKLIPL